MLDRWQIKDLVVAAVKVADAYVAKLDREARSDCVLPGEYAASPQPPAGTPTDPANADGSFDEPVRRPVWMTPSDPREGVTYRLQHAVDGSLALIGIKDSAADGPMVVDASEVVARFQGGAVDAPVPVIYDARDAADVAPRGTYAEPASPSVPTPPSA